MNIGKSAWIIAFGLILASLIFGLFFYSSRQSPSTIRVVGYSTQEFEADIVKWYFTFSEVVPLDGLPDGYAEMKDKRDLFLEKWGQMDIPTDEINIQPVTVRKNYGQYGKVVGNILDQNIYLVSKEIDRVEEIAVNPTTFAKEGIGFEYSNLQYYSTKLPELKKKLLGRATENALERAEEIAGSTGRNVEEIVSARAGVFQITEPYSTDVSDYGIHSTSTRKKNIRVTVSAVFTLE